MTAETGASQIPIVPGEILPGSGTITIFSEGGRVEIDVVNTGDRPIQIGSHYHFFEVNRALRFDRAAAYGYRLAIPSGAAVRFEPGESRPVELVLLGGTREVWGCNGLVEGPLDAVGMREAALVRARERGFLDSGGMPAAADAGNGGSDGSAS